MEKKNRYSKSEILDILAERTDDYEKELSYEKGAKAELKEELKRVSAELEAYKNRDNLINSTLKSAEEKAEEIRKTAELKYITEFERLKNFKERWNKYFGYLAETYPYYAATEETKRILAVLDGVLGKKENAQGIEELDESLSGVRIAFNPKEKIESYIAATTAVSDNGFDMDAVLNPGELDLEDLCKELGLMENE